MTALVLLPGLDGTGVLFEPLVAALPPELSPRVVSFPRDRELSYEKLRERVRETLPKREPFLLLGESFSGPLALFLAAEHPRGLLGVVLCATFVRCPVPYLPRGAERLARPALFRMFPRFSQVKALVGGYSTPVLHALLMRAHGTVSPAVFAARLREVIAVDATEALRTCPVPILYVQGSRDMVVPAGNLRRITRVRPDVRSVALKAPHLVLQTRPAEAAEAISSFAREMSSAAADRATERRHGRSAGRA